MLNLCLIQVNFPNTITLSIIKTKNKRNLKNLTLKSIQKIKWDIKVSHISSMFNNPKWLVNLKHSVYLSSNRYLNNLKPMLMPNNQFPGIQLQTKKFPHLSEPSSGILTATLSKWDDGCLTTLKQTKRWNKNTNLLVKAKVLMRSKSKFKATDSKPSSSQWIAILLITVTKMNKTSQESSEAIWTEMS